MKETTSLVLLAVPERFGSDRLAVANMYDPERLAELGWTYYAVGRGASVQAVV